MARSTLILIFLHCYGLIPALPMDSTTRARAQEQYKNVHRDLITAIARGRIAEARRGAADYLAAHPDDLESLFVLAICHARQGELDRALAVARESVDKGLPIERFLAGPRTLLMPLTQSEAFQAWAVGRGLELIHGPMLGALTGASVHVWLRTWHEVPVQVTVSEDRGMTRPFAVSGTTSKTRDYTCTLNVDGLQPATDYYYQLTVAGRRLPEIHAFTTMPAERQPARFSIVFGGGAGYTPVHERMWTVIAAHRPLAYMALGDNVYIDTPKVPETQQYCYYRRQSRPEYRKLIASTAVFAIWDDHDFITNDAEGGPETDVPAWKRDVWRTFRNNFANPAYGDGEAHPGCWFSCRIADVEFFLLDGRYYRSREKKSMLGPVQKAWLLDALKTSSATFKVICSDVPMTANVKPGSKDTWDGFAEEREEILRCIDDHRVSGVFVIAADRHRSDAWKTDRGTGYPLFEFQSSRLTNVHKHGLIPGSLVGYNEKCSFGMLTFDTAQNDPQVTFDVINIDDEKKASLTLYLSELSW